MYSRRSLRRLAFAAPACLGLALLAGPPAHGRPQSTSQAKPEATAKPAATAKAAEQAKSGTEAATIAIFEIGGPLTESAGADELSLLMGKQPLALRELRQRLDKACADPAVKAVVLLAEDSGLGMAQAEEVRQSLNALRSAGKPVYAVADSLGMREYALLSGATRLSVVPTGDLWITGLFGETPYVRGLLDLLGVKPDFLHCGAYKSASEIFMREGPSPEADAMTNWLFDGLYGALIGAIAKGRNVEPAKVRQWIDDGPYTAERAKSAGLIDAVEHRQDLEAFLKQTYGAQAVFDHHYAQTKDAELDFSSPFALFKVLGEMMGPPKKKAHGKPAVGIVYVDGPIQLGDADAPNPLAGGGPTAASSAIRRALDEAAEDDSVRAVVLRIDSGGGSATASEIILDATRRVKARKPLVVSMGNVAGSGGYYVACASDVIFADEATITGSIGVVSGKLATNEMWKKVGITFKAYQRGKAAGLLSTSSVFSDEERARMQRWMDDVYGTFKKHVTDIRGSRLKKPIEDLAGGRVYTGRQALELGLVDRIGTLEDAIQYAAAEAKLGAAGEYEVRAIPPPKNLLERLLAGLQGSAESGSIRLDGTSSRAGAAARGSLADLATPYLQHLDPTRVERIRSVLGLLDLMQAEGVVLTTPELLLFGR